MNRFHNTITAVFVGALSLFARTHIDNFSFTTMESPWLQSREYNLYDLLDEGKHLYAHATFNGWGHCILAVPELNDLWRDYGCNACDSFNLMTLSFNIFYLNSKQEFLDNWIIEYTVTHPCVAFQEGGEEFYTNLGQPNGGPKYLIFPDRTYLQIHTYQLEEHIELIPHTCSIPIISGGGYMKSSAGIFLQNITRERITAIFEKPGNYEINFFNPAGKLVKSLEKRLCMQGVNIFDWSQPPATGIYIIEFKDEVSSSYRRVIIK